jgi:DNA mismatch repair protein MutS2
MKLFPESASHQLEFDKIKELLTAHCRSEYARTKATELRIHTSKKFIEPQLLQTHQYKLLVENQLYFPDDAVLNLSKELRLLSIEASVLSGEQFLQIKNSPTPSSKFFVGFLLTEKWLILLWLS